MKKFVVICLFVFLSSRVVFAAVGCTLNDPDRDIRNIFPEATNYKTEFISIKDKGGEVLKAKIEEKLGDRLDNLYEAIDVPYAYYIVLNKKEVIGYVHGVNQKGMYGGMQLILATDLEGEIKAFYYQKISSPEAKKFKDKTFTDMFLGLGIKDFLERNLSSEIKDPSENSKDDFIATIRGLKKNLILFNVLMEK